MVTTEDGIDFLVVLLGFCLLVHELVEFVNVLGGDLEDVMLGGCCGVGKTGEGFQGLQALLADEALLLLLVAMSVINALD